VLHLKQLQGNISTTVTLITSIVTFLCMPKTNAELLTIFYDKEEHATLLLTELIISNTERVQ